MGVFFTDKIRMSTLNLFTQKCIGIDYVSLYKIFRRPGAFVSIDPYTEIYDPYSIKLRKLDFQRNGNPS
jgi:hypothetical protein